MAQENLLSDGVSAMLKELEDKHPLGKRLYAECVKAFGNDEAEIKQVIKTEYNNYLRATGQYKSPTLAKSENLPLDEKTQQLAENILSDFAKRFYRTYKLQCTFRGLPIQWKSVERMQFTPNAFGDPLEEADGYKHFICYNGKEYEPDDFFAAVFGGEYKKYPYRVKFKGQTATDIMKISVSQRTKLQYNILVHHFGLVDVSEEDEQELKAFFETGDNLTAQRIAHKMQVENGVRKVVTFGCGLKVDGAYPGTWCYCVEPGKDKAIYKGKTLTWKEWAATTQSELQRRRDDVLRLNDWKMEFYMKMRPDEVEAWKRMLHHNNSQHQYTTLPLKTKEKLEIWMYQFMRDGEAGFPFPDGVMSEEYSFSVDYNTDVEIVKNWALKKEMAAYNRAQNAERNKEHGKNRVAKRAAQTLPEGDFTRDDLKALGYGEKAISNLLRDKLIVDTKRRTPDRKYIYQKNSV